MGIHKKLIIQNLDDEIEKSLSNDYCKFCKEIGLSSDESPCKQWHFSSKLKLKKYMKKTLRKFKNEQ
jgi:hypothetical protein